MICSSVVKNASSQKGASGWLSLKPNLNLSLLNKAMPNFVSTVLPPSPRRTLRREIAAALLIKAVLLWGLWYVAFRHDGDKPANKPDIAELFRSTKASTPPQSSANSKEKTYAIG